MRALALLTLLAVLLPLALPAQAHDGLGKAEPALQAAIARGGEVTVVVQGPALPSPASAPQDRAAWRAHWAQASAPFLGELRQRVSQLGGEVLGVTAPVDAAHVRMQSALVPQLLAWGSVQRAGLDTPDSIHVSTTLGEAATLEQVPTVQALGYDGSGVKLAMVDTGVRPGHEMFANADGSSRVAQWFDATVAPGGSGYCAM
ncbi:MAG: hypothetical protein LC624_12420, partial [Halobacteriales archaeon]|nr:hypothetical protein [Halobacteriales archaeon]